METIIGNIMKFKYTPNKSRAKQLNCTGDRRVIGLSHFAHWLTEQTSEFKKSGNTEDLSPEIREAIK